MFDHSNSMATYHLKMLAYIGDCTLATVAYMALLKRRSKHEYERQIGIAQKIVHHVKAEHPSDVVMYGRFAQAIGLHPSHRVSSVISKYNGSVAAWARAVEEGTNRDG